MYQNNYKKSDRQQNYVEKAVNIHFNEKDEIVGENGTSYVDVANEVIKLLKPGSLTTSKIRSILSMIAEIYKAVVIDINAKLSDEMISRIQYFKIRCVYEAGRELSVKYFLSNANIVELIKEIGDNRKRLINYYHYIEALVAWFRYSGGKD